MNDMTDLQTAAQRLLNVLDECLHINDYSCLEVSKIKAYDVTDAIEALRTVLAKARG